MLRSKFIRLFYIMLLGMLFGAVPALAQTEDDGDAQAEASAPLTAEQLTDPMVAENAITLVFDLYVGGRYQGDVVVTYTDTLLTLHAPEEAVDMFPNVKNPAALLPLLANPIETDRTVPGLGRVHINRALFRVEVFIEPQHLTIQKINITEEDLEPEKKFTLRSDFKVNGTTDFDSDPSRLSVFHRTRPSVGRNHIDWQGIMNRGQGYDLTDLAFAHETGQLTYRAGLLETDGQRFASSREFTGFEVGTTEKTLFNNPLHQGTRLEVFVPESAKVDIFRGEQIIFSRILDFGLQEIDTSRFPGGEL